ncbi:MAG: pyruvate kinase, partial [Succinivibrionaceae bacterium]|nr:pyruvate kinase [Succinivibrionaceae bacterium]
MKKTKIVCTIGPKSEKKEVLAKVLAAGMNCMRLNFSHGDFEEHGGRIIRLRALMAETGKTCA